MAQEGTLTSAKKCGESGDVRDRWFGRKRYCDRDDVAEEPEQQEKLGRVALRKQGGGRGVSHHTEQ